MNDRINLLIRRRDTYQWQSLKHTRYYYSEKASLLSSLYKWQHVNNLYKANSTTTTKKQYIMDSSRSANIATIHHPEWSCIVAEVKQLHSWQVSLTCISSRTDVHCLLLRQRTPFHLTLTERFLRSNWSPLCSCSEIILGPTEMINIMNQCLTKQCPKRRVKHSWT